MSEQIMDFSQFLEKVAKKLQDNVLLEMRDDASKKIAKMGQVTVRREMRNAGVRRSTEAGLQSSEHFVRNMAQSWMQSTRLKRPVNTLHSKWRSELV